MEIYLWIKSSVWGAGGKALMARPLKKGFFGLPQVCQIMS